MILKVKLSSSYETKIISSEIVTDPPPEVTQSPAWDELCSAHHDGYKFYNLTEGSYLLDYIIRHTSQYGRIVREAIKIAKKTKIKKFVDCLDN